MAKYDQIPQKKSIVKVRSVTISDVCYQHTPVSSFYAFTKKRRLDKIGQGNIAVLSLRDGYFTTKAYSNVS